MATNDLQFLSIGWRNHERWQQKDDEAVIRLMTPTDRLREVVITEDDVIKTIANCAMILDRFKQTRDAIH